MAYFNVVQLQSTKTYATPATAEKAVRKWVERFEGQTREFNVFIMPTEGGRCFPVLCNISQSFFQRALHSGFSLVN